MLLLYQTVAASISLETMRPCTQKLRHVATNFYSRVRTDLIVLRQNCFNIAFAASTLFPRSRHKMVPTENFNNNVFIHNFFYFIVFILTFFLFQDY